ncbi:hypothetical protein [Rhodosalinus sp. FB01]|uniref:hypothetical protein n=1 Tax=Rhodosalinus sp. FB01 TaxID=3239194 RepID=UPI00352635BA
MTLATTLRGAVAALALGCAALPAAAQGNDAPTTTGEMRAGIAEAWTAGGNTGSDS